MHFTTEMWSFSFYLSKDYDRLLITSWGHDPGVVPTSNVLTMLNDALTHSAVLIQVSTFTTDTVYYYTSGSL